MPPCTALGPCWIPATRLQIAGKSFLPDILSQVASPDRRCSIGAGSSLAIDAVVAIGVVRRKFVAGGGNALEGLSFNRAATRAGKRGFCI
jgi:hypothetical protein